MRGHRGGSVIDGMEEALCSLSCVGLEDAVQMIVDKILHYLLPPNSEKGKQISISCYQCLRYSDKLEGPACIIIIFLA